MLAIGYFTGYSDGTCFLGDVQMWLILRAIKGQFSKELFLVVVVICWKIWEVQNSEMHGLEEGFPSDLVS